MDRIKQVPNDRKAFEERVRRILDNEVTGVVAIFTLDDYYLDFATEDVTSTQYRDALLDLARDLAAYQGD